MTTVNQKGKYGRYIYGLLTLSDMALVNILFWVVTLIDPEIHLFDQKIFTQKFSRASNVPTPFIFRNSLNSSNGICQRKKSADFVRKRRHL